MVAELFQRSALQGNADSHVSYGLAAMYGEGMEKSEVEAVKWYCVAASQGRPIGQYIYKITSALCIAMVWARSWT